MTLKFSRSLDEMRAVLLFPESSGIDPVYEVFTDLDNGWINKTIISPGVYGQEFSKTFGHIHLDNKDETYSVESGNGVILMQSPDEILLIKISAGQKYTINHKYAHCLINVGSENLVTFDDHINPQSNYEIIKNKHGLAYYLINDNDQIKTVPNPNYPNLPEPKWESI